MVNDLIGKLFDGIKDGLMRTQRGRWIFGAICVLLGLLTLPAAFQPAPPVNHILYAAGALFFVALGLIILIGNLLLGRKRRAADALVAGAEARTKQLLAEGKLLPIPQVPKPLPKGISPQDEAQVETYVAQMRAISWGADSQITDDQAHPTFERTVAFTRRVAGDWSKLAGPIQTFRDLPKPLSYVGAAEVMFRLSFLRGTTYSPAGLRQGLFFALHAQVNTPLQPDALAVQARLLAACRATSWQKLAGQTIEMLRGVAPEHPRLPVAEAFYHEMRGDFDQALAFTDQVIARPPSPEERYAALSRKSIILMDLKRYPEAVATCDAMLAQDPNDPWTWHNKSIMLMRMGDYAAALQCNERALAIMDFGTARNTRELILRKMAESEG